MEIQFRLKSIQKPGRAIMLPAVRGQGQRQRTAIEKCAKANGFRLVGEFYDKAVSGVDRIGFSSLLVIKLKALASAPLSLRIGKDS